MIDKVISSGICIGCGACTAANNRIKIIFNRYGDLVAELPSEISHHELAAASNVCPFANESNETEIASTLFPGTRFNPEIGYYSALYAGYAPGYRPNGSSGGVVTWLLCYLIEKKLVDGVIHVSPDRKDRSERFFDFQLSRTSSEISGGSTSFYYPVSMDGVLNILKSTPGRYAITGIPCFQKALRLLRNQDNVINERIAYQIGITCGQMKSSHYLEYLSGQAGISAQTPIESACFRRKVDNLPANDYAFEVKYRPDGAALETRQVLNSEIGANWGMGYFKPEACEFCDDLIAETADFCAMDAWLPKYVKDGAGWSLMVVRDKTLLSTIKDGISEGHLIVEGVKEEEVAESQRGGFNHRRGALAYRLWMKRHKWLPKKRVSASNNLHPFFRIEQHLRELLRTTSRAEWLSTGHKGNFIEFQKRMKKYELLYRLLYKVKRLFV